MLVHWIWFAELKGLSLHQKQELLQHFRDPEEIYYSEPDVFSGLQGAAQALEEKDLGQAQEILRTCAEKGIGILTFGDEAYPTRLRNIHDAPMVLYFKGTLPDWERVPVIGIVGTRKATPYGVNTARRFGRQIAACGALVVSGGAYGIDTSAMQGALDVGCPVVGVLGCGVDVVYPQSNKQFFAQVMENGCLISEYPPQMKPKSWSFPARNRIISGISNGVLVVEAPERSGALNTARRALEQGRDVFAVPGNVDVDSCAGSNGLLQEQAMAALSGWDVVREYEALYPGKVRKQEAVLVAREPRILEKTGVQTQNVDKKSIDKEEKSSYSGVNNTIPALTEAERDVLARIGREPVSVDEIIDQLELTPAAIKGALTKLAIKKLVISHPGGRVSLK